MIQVVKGGFSMSHWWENHPWRMIQTNLREQDMEDLDAERFVRDLQKFDATVVMVNAAGIVASYFTAIPDHTQSAHLHGDSLKSLLDACHKAGIRVIARTDFSKIRHPIADRHPDWLYRSAEGKVFDCNGDIQVCPNSAYQRQVLYDIVKELLTALPFDGIFFNMSGAFVTGYDGTLYGPCMCDTCKRLYREQTGLEPPAAGLRDPGFMRYVGFQSKQIAINKARQMRFIRDINPEVAVNGFDYLRTECNTDIGRGAWVYCSSANARSGGRRQIVDNACVDFVGFRYRDTSVSPALTELRLWQSLANGGGLSYYIMGRLDNHRDVSGYERVQKVFAFHKRNEEVYAGLRSAASVLVVEKGGMSREDPEVYGWVHSLTQSHVPFDTCKLQELTAQALDGKSVVLLGDVRPLSAGQAELLDAFAENGGTVLATGDTGIAGNAIALKCLGITAVGARQKGLMSTALEVSEADRAVFARCADAPVIAIGGDFRMVAFAPEAKTYLRLIPEHPYGPPERCYPVPSCDQPGVAVHPYGAGRGIYVPALLGSLYYREGWQNTLNFMQDLLFGLCGLPELVPGVSAMVELTLAKKEGCAVVQLVNESGCFDGHYFPPVPIGDLHLRLPGLAGHSVRTLSGGQISCRDDDGDLEIRLDVLNSYEAIVIQ